jgi:hypothetical protein
MKTAGWFEVDKDGLAKLVERKGKAFVLYELLQNAWDCGGVTVVDVKLEAVASKPYARLVVTDDHPDGFADLAHAYTLFAESEKKGDTARRGRFNLGEKLVLALCESARITSTRGTVVFSERGRMRPPGSRASGTEFSAIVRMTRGELEEVLASVQQVIPPDNVVTVVNGVEIPRRKPAKVIAEAFLQTEVADASGSLRRKYQDTMVEIYVPRQGEKATLYEMGIPVMDLGDDPYHVNVMQKVPLSMERDAVTPGYLRDVRAAVLDHMHEKLSTEQARGKWASDAIEESVNPEAVKTLVAKRFGEKAVIYDPSDREANNIATARGFTVISGGAFTADAWDKIKSAEAVLPAGQVTPSPRPFHPDGEPLKLVPQDEWSPGMATYAAMVRRLALELEGIDILVCFTQDRGWKFGAAYGKLAERAGTMTVNAGRLGASWFEPGNLSDQLGLFIHELGHHYGHHLEESYHEALCRIGGKLAAAALDRPEWFRR